LYTYLYVYCINLPRAGSPLPSIGSIGFLKKQLILLIYDQKNLLNLKTTSMKILILMELLRKMQVLAVIFKIRIVTIGFSSFSCDIYPHKHATFRSDKRKLLDRTALAAICSGIIKGSPVALVCNDECHQYAGKPRFSTGILSLLKPGSDSYPACFTIKSYST